MTRLDQLIQRIEYPIKVSTEDAMDVVKQYWEEAANTVSTYWDDTDKEVAEEIGVPKPTLSQLLDQHGNGTAYANRGGNSGVDSYVLGDDWILVNFTTGAKYLYTHKSTAYENIEQMKRYANEGRGLNSFIMRISKDGYAGRNIKGNILIRPGMEHYRQQANKRLQLLYAFRNAKMATVSNEGFFDSIKKAMGISNKNEETDFKRGYTYNHNGFANMLKRTFGDKDYLAKQTFVTGPIDSKGIANWVGVNGKADIQKTIAENNKFEKIRATWQDALTGYFVKIKPVLEKYKDGPYNDATYDALKGYFDKTPPPALPQGLVPKGGWFTGEVNGDIEALDEATVFKATNDIAASLENIWTKYDSNREKAEERGQVYLANDWVNLAHADNPNISKFETKHSAQEWQAIARRMDGLVAYWSDPEWSRALKAYRETFYACAKWIDRSIKGKHIVSSENISNEGIFDAIKRLFIADRTEEKKPVTPDITYVWDEAGKIEKSPPRVLTETSSNSAIFQINGAYNPKWLAQLDSDIRQYERITKELTAYDRKLKAWHDKWDPEFDTFSGNVDRKDEFAAVVKAAIKEQPTPWLEVFRNNYEFVGWGKSNWDGEYGFGDNPMTGAPTVSIPMVNEANTRQVVAMIAKLGKFMLNSYEVEDQLAFVSYDFTDAPFRGYYFEDEISDILNGIKYHMDAAITSRDHFGVIEDRIEQILKALVAYVKSAESNSVGNEVYMHNTISTYQAQLTKAGADGLDSTARQFMAIGLESMAQVETPPMYLPGSNVASLEGVWDSIKDFFAGRPTKIHLSGADRGIRAKLDRTINDRTWLSRQKYTLGEVNYRALPDFNPVSARKYVQDYRLAVNSTSQHNSREMAKIKERLAAVPRMVSMYASKDIFDTTLIQSVINDIAPYSIRLNINIQEPPLMSTEMTTQTGQALTKVEVKEFAEMIAQVHAIQTAYENSIYVSPALQWTEMVRFRYANKPGGQEVIAAIQRAVQAYQNVVLLINREIKQRVTTHAAWINAENIADSLVNYIGKSITNVTTNSFESFNAPIVPSNEDLLSAVKKFFTPNKDKGIYDTVNKGFLQDLAKEVKKYADPNWVKTHGANESKTIEVDGANLIDAYDQVVSDFIAECKANRTKQHEACEMAFKNMDEVISMIDRKQLNNTENVQKAITILKATRGIKAPRVEVPKVNTEIGTVKTLSPQEITEAATKLLELFNTLGADTTYVERWNKSYRNSAAWMDWKYVGKANYKELYDQVKDPKFTDLYQKAMEHVYDMTYIGAEFHKLKPYVMAIFQLIEKSVKDS